MSGPDALAAAAALAAAPGVALDHAPIRPFETPRSAHPPGIAPLDPDDWLHSDETYAAQMAARDALIAAARPRVVARLPAGEAAERELLDLVVAHAQARHGLERVRGGARRRDGVTVAFDDAPIAVAGRLAQEDFLILDRPEDAAEPESEHRLVSGVLCFPAFWTLTEKIGRPLARIHKPVAGYEGGLARRVQRLFDGVRPGRPLWRANWNFQAGRGLWTPMSEAEKIGPAAAPRRRDDAAWLRVERQTVLRLPRSGAVVFGVRTLITPIARLTDEDWAGLARALSELPEAERRAKAGDALLAEAARRGRRAL